MKTILQKNFLPASQARVKLNGVTGQ